MTTPSDHELQAVTDDERRRAAVTARRREQWLRRQAEEEGTFHGVLVDLAERRVGVAVQTRAGRTLTGELSVVGHDVVAIVATGSTTAVVPLGALTGVRPEPGVPASLGDRPADASGSSFESTVADLVHDRPEVTVHLVDGDRTRGRLWRVGQDFLAVRSSAGADAYLPFTAVNDVVVG